MDEDRASMVDPGMDQASDETHAAIGRSNRSGGERGLFWQFIPDAALDQEKQQAGADAWARKHDAALADQWATLHMDALGTDLAKIGIHQRNDGSYYQLVDQQPAPSAMPQTPEAELSWGGTPIGDQSTPGPIASKALGYPDQQSAVDPAQAGDQGQQDYLGDLGRTGLQAFAGSAPGSVDEARRRGEDQGGNPDLPGLPFNLLGPGSVLPYQPPKPTRDVELEEKVRQGQPFNGEDFVNGLTKAAGQQYQMTPAAIDGLPGVRLGTSEEEAAKRFSLGLGEGSGGRGLGGLVHAAGEVGSDSGGALESAAQARRQAVNVHYALTEDLKARIAAGEMTPDEADAHIAQSKAAVAAALQGAGAVGGGVEGVARRVESLAPSVADADPALTALATVAGTIGTPNGRRSAAQLIETGVHVAASMSEKLRPREREFKAELSPVQPWIDKAQTIRYADMLANVVGRAADVGIGVYHTVELPVLDVLEGMHGDAAALGAAKERVKGIVGAVPAAFQAALENFTTSAPSSSSRIEGGMSGGRRAFGNGPIGRAINLVPDFMAASDDFFKTINGAGAIYAEAYKIARRTGRDVVDVLSDPSHNLAEKALRAGEYVTYTEHPGGVVKWLGDGARQPGKAGFLISLAIPFVKVGANIATRGTKAAVAPIIGPVEAAFRLAQGDKEAARQAMARTELAAGLGLLWWSQWAQGNVTGNGPDDPRENAAWRAAGNRPNSVKVAGQPIPLAALGAPGAQAIILVNGLDAAMRNPPLRAQRKAIAAGTPQDASVTGLDPSTEKFLMQWIAGAASGIGDISYLKQIADLFKSGGPSNPGFLARTASSFVGGDITNRVGQAIDPVQREIAKGGLDQFTDTLKSRVPGLRRTLPVKQDSLGRDVPNPGYGRLMPADESDQQASPALREILAAGVTPSAPPPSISVDGISVPLDRAEQRAYQKYAGEFVEKYVGAQAAKPGWATRTASQRAAVIKTIQADAHQLAAERVQHDIGGAELKRRIREVRGLQPAPIR